MLVESVAEEIKGLEKHDPAILVSQRLYAHANPKVTHMWGFGRPRYLRAEMWGTERRPQKPVGDRNLGT